MPRFGRRANRRLDPTGIAEVGQPTSARTLQGGRTTSEPRGVHTQRPSRGSLGPMRDAAESRGDPPPSGPTDRPVRGRYPPEPGAVAIVTGAASGIGAALARRLAADGARVVATDIDAAGAAAVASGIGGESRTLDVSDAAATRRVIDDVERSLGPVGIYCSNAGIPAPGGIDTAVEDWQRSWEVHVLAHFHAARVLVPRWIERGGGILVVTASAAGLLTQLNSASYAVTKHAAVAAAEWLAITHGHQGVQVAALCPQAVRTPLLEGLDGPREPASSTGATVPAPSAAAVDGVLEPDAVADATAEALREGRFLVLPHPETATYVKRRADDPDRWLAGMRRLARRMAG